MSGSVSDDDSVDLKPVLVFQHAFIILSENLHVKKLHALTKYFFSPGAISFRIFFSAADSICVSHLSVQRP